MNDHLVEIFVNTDPHEEPQGKITYDRLVQLAFGEGADVNAGYKVTGSFIVDLLSNGFRSQRERADWDGHPTGEDGAWNAAGRPRSGRVAAPSTATGGLLTKGLIPLGPKPT